MLDRGVQDLKRHVNTSVMGVIRAIKGFFPFLKLRIEKKPFHINSTLSKNKFFFLLITRLPTGKSMVIIKKKLICIYIFNFFSP